MSGQTGGVQGMVRSRQFIVALAVIAMMTMAEIAVAARPSKDDSSDDRRGRQGDESPRPRGGKAVREAPTPAPRRAAPAPQPISPTSSEPVPRLSTPASPTPSPRFTAPPQQDMPRRVASEGHGAADVRPTLPRSGDTPVKSPLSRTGGTDGPTSAAVPGKPMPSPTGVTGRISTLPQPVGRIPTGDRSAISDVRKRFSEMKPGPEAGTSNKSAAEAGTKSVSSKPVAESISKPGPRKAIVDGVRKPAESGPSSAMRTVDSAKTGMIRSPATGSAAVVKSKAEMQTLARDRFPDRLKSGQLDAVVKGPSAQSLKLSDQYKMAGQGDVARRLDLQKNVKTVVNVKNTTNITNVTNVTNIYHHTDQYHGQVTPGYAHSCFEFNYCGPHFFAGVCWYPTWNPWVDWSWHCCCHPVWDPRPIWCRPVIYEPCPVLVYYDVPVWRPLPVVASGTWVDVPPPTTPPAQSDLQLMAVRFVDPGHPEEKLGPRYRIWFRNNSGQAITQAFNVVTVASLDGKMAQGLPQAGVRVTAVEAGDTQSVDVRLPVDVYAMGRDAQGKALSYTTLHILLDGNREVPEADRANNGASLPLANVLPVDPAAFEIDPVQAPPGGELILAGEGFGPEPGRVLVQVNGQELDGEIAGWYDLGVKVRLPKLTVAGPTPAEVIAVRGDGAAANPLKVTVLP